MKFTVVKNGNTLIYCGGSAMVTRIVSVPPKGPDCLNEYRTRIRDCYRDILHEEYEKGVRSVAFDLCGSLEMDMSKEEELRIAADVISEFNPEREMIVYLVAHGYGEDDRWYETYSSVKHFLRDYIDKNYESEDEIERRKYNVPLCSPDADFSEIAEEEDCSLGSYVNEAPEWDERFELDFELSYKLRERMKHMSDTFSQYLMYLIESRNMKNADVYKRAIVDKKTFSKIKNNVDYHPDKITALCLCIGAELNLDESKDLLARAGYALSPCNKTDLVFSYFIENEIYDMIELDIQLEELGLPCLIS